MHNAEDISTLKRYKMAMIRPKGKAKKIAFKILGKPANMQEKPDKKKRKVNQRLLYEETQRAR